MSLFATIDIDQLSVVTGGAMGIQTEPGPGQAIPPYPIQNNRGVLQPRSDDNRMNGGGNMPLIGPNHDPGHQSRQIGV
jgi:hypothetical protein